MGLASVDAAVEPFEDQRQDRPEQQPQQSEQRRPKRQAGRNLQSTSIGKPGRLFAERLVGLALLDLRVLDLGLGAGFGRPIGKSLSLRDQFGL